MGKYGNVAINAASSLASRQYDSPREAWHAAVKMEYPTQTASQEKGCPRGAFIGLCEAGLVRGIEYAATGRQTKNGGYAVAAVESLRLNPALASDKSALWRQACPDQPKKENGQMDVVLTLLDAGLLNAS
ncbi:hypothetical protein GN330_07680 [Nitratireductor sp. CAU 1489]|jgi:hypothetical protein|uniref:Uncharacterized protein n=1 Tax=Nitratireductor arenosus TaxID=2682096 RepID=A0A844QGE3_9HYPH|nr:hypothetical protein [Nitratireductor arenosus]MVA97128.1 hypothetical protein [Nitratireductor arenosus]